VRLNLVRSWAISCWLWRRTRS